MKFREDIQLSGGCFTKRWLGWGDIMDGERRYGAYFFMQLPFYKMVPDYAYIFDGKPRMTMGKLTFMEIRVFDGVTPEKYTWEYLPIDPQ